MQDDDYLWGGLGWKEELASAFNLYGGYTFYYYYYYLLFKIYQ